MWNIKPHLFFKLLWNALYFFNNLYVLCRTGYFATIFYQPHYNQQNHMIMGHKEDSMREKPWAASHYNASLSLWYLASWTGRALEALTSRVEQHLGSMISLRWMTLTPAQLHVLTSAFKVLSEYVYPQCSRFIVFSSHVIFFINCQSWLHINIYDIF